MVQEGDTIEHNGEEYEITKHWFENTDTILFKAVKTSEPFEDYLDIKVFSRGSYTYDVGAFGSIWVREYETDLGCILATDLQRAFDDPNVDVKHVGERGVKVKDNR